MPRSKNISKIACLLTRNSKQAYAGQVSEYIEQTLALNKGSITAMLHSSPDGHIIVHSAFIKGTTFTLRIATPNPTTPLTHIAVKKDL
ncbi:hypothetical protein D9757_014675 [Collybiopsis confluens]|uniref:Uncharacterized protein n=1 Tax=Collybiopsis confluens TaxID=2823264 RepID=A0A8H5CKU0_9AGAR|nr:hypothetical protein D9757_014675 [Collybiopsis confluens]